MVTVLRLGCDGEDSGKQGAQTGAPTAALSRTTETPEETIIGFLLAMSSNNEEGVRQRILPHPDPAILWQGVRLTREKLAEVEKRFRALTFREVQAGESFRLPDGRVMIAGPPLTGEGRKLFVCERPLGLSLTFPLVKADGVWRVDASSFVAARKAAKAVRDRKARGTP